MLAIKNDDELRTLLSEVTIVQAGVMPNVCYIHFPFRLDISCVCTDFLEINK